RGALWCDDRCRGNSGRRRGRHPRRARPWDCPGRARASHRRCPRALGSTMIGIGVIGYGYWGPNLVRNFTDILDARVVHVCDLREERLALVRQRYPWVATTTRYTDVIADSRVDAIVIATPVSSHFQLAMAALRSGRHVLIEKPLAATAKE